MKYIHQHKDWPNFTWDNNQILRVLGEVRNMQGRLIGQMEALGFDLRNQAVLDTITLDVIKSTEIEGEIMSTEQVRSSIARRLGIEIPGAVDSDRNVEGMVDMMMDATQNCIQPLSFERLFNWHAALFPTGRSGMYKISVSNWRNDSTGPMQVVSGPMGYERVHFQAPDSDLIDREMDAFVYWVNNEDKTDLVIKSAIAHLWFVTIHPFDDGNGRIARALTDLLLARSDGSPQRFYSMSAQIRVERKGYYDILEKTQKGELDITEWLIWFINCLKNALQSTDVVLKTVLAKTEFWKKNASTIFNERQKKLVNKLLDGFNGKLTTSKWSKIAKCSSDTALRDIQDLVNKNVLSKEGASGRSTSYVLKD
jgi:Fic family protein